MEDITDGKIEIQKLVWRITSPTCPEPPIIDLNNNSMKKKSAKIAANTLIEEIKKEKNNCRRNLSLLLQNNQLDQKSATYLAKLLKTPNCSVNFLDISHNNLADEGLNILLKSLKSKKCVSPLEISLSANNISHTGFNKFVKALVLAKLPPELEIDFSYNKIGNEGAIALANALKIFISKNSRIKLIIHLENNTIHDEGISALQEVMKDCPENLKLHLSGNPSKFLPPKTTDAENMTTLGVFASQKLNDPQISLSSYTPSNLYQPK